jgi:hypothetical protein
MTTFNGLKRKKEDVVPPIITGERSTSTVWSHATAVQNGFCFVIDPVNNIAMAFKGTPGSNEKIGEYSIYKGKIYNFPTGNMVGGVEQRVEVDLTKNI